MADEIKFSEEELQSLSELSQGYQNIQSAFGQVKVQRILAQQQLDNLDEADARMDSDYTDLQQKERDLVAQLNEKYGPGTLDPQTGVFTPTPQDQPVEEAEKSSDDK
jgi:hypothetical protein|tara:strand:- start:322 stop:642 length:321 start_codon:yes stop_codon:yes gene_type:complete